MILITSTKMATNPYIDLVIKATKALPKAGTALAKKASKLQPLPQVPARSLPIDIVPKEMERTGMGTTVLNKLSPAVEINRGTVGADPVGDLASRGYSMWREAMQKNLESNPTYGMTGVTNEKGDAIRNLLVKYVQDEAKRTETSAQRLYDRSRDEGEIAGILKEGPSLAKNILWDAPIGAVGATFMGGTELAQGTPMGKPINKIMEGLTFLPEKVREGTLGIGKTPLVPQISIDAEGKPHFKSGGPTIENIIGTSNLTSASELLRDLAYGAEFGGIAKGSKAVGKRVGDADYREAFTKTAFPEIAPLFYGGTKGPGTSFAASIPGGKQLSQFVEGIVSGEKALKEKRKADIPPLEGEVYKAPEQGKIGQALTRVREIVDDNMIRQKQLENRKDVKITDESSPYLAEQLYHGRVSTRLEGVKSDFENMAREFTESAKKEGVKQEDFLKEVNDYLIARHAPERNAAIGEGAAGITTEGAKLRKQELEEKTYGSAIVKAADRAQEVNRKTLEILKEGGLIDDATVKMLTEKYENHVPLQRIMENEDFSGITGKGFSTKTSGLKKAKGSSREVNDVMGNIAFNLEQAITRSEKNRVAQSVLNFAKENGDKVGMKVIEQAPTNPMELQSFYKDPKNVSVFENGKQKFVRIEDEMLAKALGGVNMETIPTILKPMQALSRTYSALATRFNPDFVFPNLIRDLQDAAINAARTVGYKGTVKQIGKQASSLSDVRAAIAGKNTPGARLYQQMKEDGGTTGGMSAQTRGDVQLSWDKIKQEAKGGAGQIPKKSIKKVIQVVEDSNTIVEDATRLSAYKQGLENGMSRKRAAEYAKNVTVNFNKKGTAGPVISAMYMFANASIQGIKTPIRMLKNPKVAIPVIGTVLATVNTVDDYNNSIDPNWRDKVSSFDRDKGLIILYPNQSGDDIAYFTVPVSYSLKPIKGVADLISDARSGQMKDPASAVGDLASKSFDTFNVMGGTDLVSTLTPTAFDLPVDIARNRNFAGNLIRPEGERPSSEKFFESLKKKAGGQQLIDVTKGIRDKTGIEVSPADLMYGYEQLTGGTGKFIERLASTGQSAAKGEVAPVSEIPFINRFMKVTSDEQLQKSQKYKNFDDLYETLRKKNPEDRKSEMQKFILNLPEDERGGALYRIMLAGFETKGVKSKAENIIEMEKRQSPSEKRNADKAKADKARKQTRMSQRKLSEMQQVAKEVQGVSREEARRILQRKYRGISEDSMEKFLNDVEAGVEFQ